MIVGSACSSMPCLHAVRIEPGDHPPLARHAGLLLDDRGERHRFLRASTRRCPARASTTASASVLLHRRLHPREHRGAGFAALEIVAVGQHRAFGRAPGSAPVSSGSRHQPLVDHDRGQAFGHGDEAADHLRRAGACRGSCAGLAPAGSRNSPRLDRIAAAEDLGAQQEAVGRADQRLPPRACARPRSASSRRAR